MVLLVTYVSIALFFSFICSILEAVLLSVTPSYQAALERRDTSVGHLLTKLKNDIDRPLAAILSLNTIAHTIGAAGAGAQAAVVFGSIYVGAASAVLTLLILIFSEIIPKTIGALYWRRLTPVMVYSVTVLIYLLFPFVYLSMGITRLISRKKKHPLLNREEFYAQAELAIKAGIFEESESAILRNLFEFRSLNAGDVMTPRTVIHALEESLTVQEAIDSNPGREFTFSRIPVMKENLEHVTGYVLKVDILHSSVKGKTPRKLSELKRNLLFVPETLAIPDLLALFLEKREHIALVVDEYGGTAGLVTLEDVMETLLGIEIVDEKDAAVDMRAVARKEWEKRARQKGITLENNQQEKPAEGKLGVRP